MDLQNEISKLLPTTTYITRVKIENEKAELLEFKLLKSGNYTQYSAEEFNKDLCLQNLNPEDKESLIKNLPKLVKQETFVLKYKFKDKNGKYHFFKDILKVIDKTDNIYTILGIGIDISKEEELVQIYNTLQNSPHIGVLIYKNKFIYANKTICDILETDQKTICTLNPTDILPDKFKEKINKVVEKRLRGEEFFNFVEVETKSLNNSRRHLKFFSQTILYDHDYAGFLLAIDKTKEIKHQMLLKLISDINKILLEEKNELTLLKKCVQTIKKSKLFIDATLNLINNPQKPPQDYESLISLPIVINKKLIATIDIFSKYKNDFDKSTTAILSEITSNIQKAIENITITNILFILKEAIEKSFQWVVITDKQGNILYANDVVFKLSGYSKDELIGKNANIFKSGLHNKEFYKKLWNTVTKGEVFETEIINKRKDGTLFYLKDRIVPVKVNDNYFFVSLGMNITKEKELEAKISDLQYLDSLTALLNREGFLTKSKKIIEEYPNQKYALLLIDIKDFKIINKIKGSKFGDIVLKNIANILKENFANYLPSRIGNDEFALFIPFNNESEIIIHAQQIIEKIKNLTFPEYNPSVNIGIAYYFSHAYTPKRLLECSSIALHIAKQNENSFEIYNPSLSHSLTVYIKTKSAINKALKNDDFEYYFQPYYSLKQKKFIGAEALLRIKNTQMSTESFILYAETSGIIKQIEQKMLKKLADTARKIKIPISFNLSSTSLKDKKHVENIISFFRGIEENITIEVTERLLVDGSFEIFKKLKEKGFKIAIDDFGSGYASFKYLKNLYADILKIDKDFVQNINSSENDKKIFEIILDFANKFNMQTISEGVETKAQEKTLKELNCDLIQGFLYSKPLPLNKLQNLFKKSPQKILT